MKPLLPLTSYLLLISCSAPSPEPLTSAISPDHTLILSYTAAGEGQSLPFAELTQFGLITPLDSTSSWTIAPAGDATPLSIDYQMLTGKRHHCTNEGQQRDYLLTDGQGHTQRLEVRTLTDGVAFRYVLDRGYDEPQPLLGERTTLQFQSTDGCERWISRWTEPYEDFFPFNPEEQEGNHWGYPALFHPLRAGVTTPYVLLTEAGVERGHAASSFYTDLSHGAGYRIQPDRQQSLVQRGWATPWRVLITGSLADVVESTLVTDLAPASALTDASWIEPGVVSWIYWAYNHGSNDYDIVCQYIDMAAELHLPYVLIDAEWDEMPTHSAGHQSIEDALQYAHDKGVRPLIWYNSTTAWIDWAPGPKYRLNDPDKREQEFQWLEDHGVAGVKIDFFQGDQEQCMNYCIDLLESAARHHLLVNFHGATIPRGWMRTYPNLMSTEAVYGAEWYNNRPTLTPVAARHNATLPFTRNVIGSMDYTPCTFTDSQHPHITSHAHELALTVLFESALQHLADRPSAYLSQPEPIRQLLTTLPTVWDDTRLICGRPGEYVVLARRSGDRLYVAGINGTDAELSLDLSALTTIAQQWGITAASLRLIADNPEALYPAPVAAEADRWQLSTVDTLPTSITLAPRGGFVMSSL